MERIEIQSRSREELVDITGEVRAAVTRAGVRDGIVVVYVPHTTAAVTINENDDPHVKSDMVGHLARVVPQDPSFQHAEGNADAHIKAALIGPSAAVIVEDGEPKLGRWQGVYFCEFDGPRSREVWVQVGSAAGG